MIEWKRIKAGDYVSNDGRFRILNHPTRLYNSWELYDKDIVYQKPTLSDCKLKAESVIKSERDMKDSMNLLLVTFNLDFTDFVINAKNEDDAIKKAIVVNKEKFLRDWDEEGIEEAMENHKNYSVEHVDMFMLNELMKRNDYYGYYKDILIYGW